MSKQSSRRFNKRTQGRRDNDYSRKTTTTQGSDDGRKRQLFDPFSDNPIAFNRSTMVDKQQEKQSHITTSTSGRRSYLAQRRDGLLLRNMDDTNRRESNNNNRRLWDPNDDKKPAMQPPPQQREDPPVPTVARRRSPPTTTTTTATTTTPSNPVKDQHKRKIKAMFASIQDIEGKLVNVDAEANKLEFFKNEHDEHDRQQRQRMMDSMDKKEQRLLTQVDLADASDMWRQKVELHMALADKYLDLMEFDYAFAEKKSLDSLCWKRAIYSLVEQYRMAFKIRMTEADDLEEEEEDEEDGLEEEDNVIAESTIDIPLFSDMKRNDDEDREDEDQETALVTKSKELDMLREWFTDFLDQADNFYRRSMLILRSMDTYSEKDEEQHLQEWRRTHRLKWYKAIPNRGDLARYRWTYASKDELSFREAWQWYALGVWLMPATGKLYFHLSLLIHGASVADPTRDLHRLYFSIRSLMVRRNGFLNAREGMIVLFESNRRWVDKYLKTIQSNKGSRFGNRAKKSRQHQQTQQQEESRLTASSQDIAAALFIRLHGMLFTKISLDQFAQIKRRFFSCVFPDTKQIKSNGVTSDDDTTTINDVSRFDIHEMFWFEAAVICISSLYNYDYASSKFTKLNVLQSKRLYAESTTATTDDPTKSDSYNDLVEELKDSILFAYNVDLMTSIAVQLFRRFVDQSLAPPVTPNLPLLPPSPTSLSDNYGFIFEPRDLHESLDDSSSSSDNNNNKRNTNEPWIIFIEMLLHWMVINSVCQRPEGGSSLWELLVGNPAPDLLKRNIAEDDIDSKISPMFWPLLLDFLNNQLQSLEDDIKYELVNHFLLDDDDDNCNSTKEYTQAEYIFARLATKVLGKQPILPEEMHMRGLGWVDDITGKLLKITPHLDDSQHEASIFGSGYDLHTQRKIKVLSYGFALAKQMSHVFCYDPVLEMFVVDKGLEEQISMHQQDNDHVQSPISDANQETENDINNESPLAPTIEAMDDAVLFSNENDSVDEDGDDDMLTQLKKRREQLQAMLTTTSGINTNHRRALGRLKEREARLNRLRERVIPGQTVIVLDTNCFIGHIDHVQRLIQSNKWSIVIPLVVVTELDGLRSNTPPLGEIAGEALKFIEATLATKQRSNTHLRIQTSHNNFMHDISIRSEQFVFGETDKNLDDLVLSACLWWARDSEKDDHARVCLVTGDRNLSVKARARDIDVMSVSAIMQLTPKK
ncbi:hypothetical protein K492DRAFT_142709 [Lichtheimia hyalospora FSU 10163]|nr:hypothetical protein K492DRAFT_142709 [Lichtheimia hyalospora FSU 10163]